MQKRGFVARTRKEVLFQAQLLPSELALWEGASNAWTVTAPPRPWQTSQINDRASSRHRQLTGVATRGPVCLPLATEGETGLPAPDST